MHHRWPTFTGEPARDGARGAAREPIAALREPIAGPAASKEASARLLGILGSVALHLVLLSFLVAPSQRRSVAAPQKLVELEVIEKRAPEKPPPPPPEPEPPKPPPRAIAKVAPRPQPPPPVPQVAPSPIPPPNDPPPPEANKEEPIHIGISLSSTTEAGGFAAPVGNTLYGAAPKVAPDPGEVKPYAAPFGRYVPPYQVTRLPELVTEVKAIYPEEARKLGLEGRVVLRLVVDATGQVAEAKVLRRAGHGFDEAALNAIRRFKFKPGLTGTEPVSTEIIYTYTFVLD
jgi:protein TonB